MSKRDMEQFLGTTTMTIVEAMQKIDKNTRGLLFIVDKERKLLGSLTDGDIRRWLIKAGTLQVEVSVAMNHKPYRIHSNEKKDAAKIMKAHSIFALPVINEEGQVLDIIFDTKEVYNEPLKTLKGVPVVMMAGGKGTRLYPYTKILPKPLIPVGELPIAEHIINKFFAYGCKDFHLIVNHKKNMIKAYFNEVEKAYNLFYADEDEPLGTGGGLSLLKGKIDNTFVLTNCDTLIEADFSQIYQYHKEQNNIITMICSLKNYQIPYGVINLGNGGQIESMEEKPTFSFFTNTGCYIVDPEVIKDIPENTVVGFPDLLEKYRKEGRNVGVYPINESSWLDMGEMEALEEMRKRLEKNN